jgi:hypothetical protein
MTETPVEPDPIEEPIDPDDLLPPDGSDQDPDGDPEEEAPGE